MRSLLFCLPLAFASVAFAQADLSIVQEPENPTEGDLVTLTVRFPDGYAGEFDPIFEERFYNFPLVEMIEVPPAEEGGEPTIEAKVVGAGCSFSAGCEGAREIQIRLGSFRLVGRTIVPKTIRHVVRVRAKQGPTSPPIGLPEDPGTPIGANFVDPQNPPLSDPQADRDEALIETLEAISAGLGEIDRKLAKLQETSVAAPIAKTVAAPAPVSGAGLPASAPAKQASLPAWPDNSGYSNRKPGEVWVTAVCGVPVSPYRVGGGPISTPGPLVAAPMRMGAGTPSLPTGGRWNISGDWSPTYGQTLSHLRSSDHVSFSTQYEPLDRFSHGQLRWIHDQHHDAIEGRAPSVYSQPTRAIPAASACPGGVCPTGVMGATGGGWYPGKLIGRGR